MMFPASQAPPPPPHPGAPPGSPHPVAAAAVDRLAAPAAAAITNNSNTTNPTQNPPLTPSAINTRRPVCLTAFRAARLATAPAARLAVGDR